MPNGADHIAFSKSQYYNNGRRKKRGNIVTEVRENKRSRKESTLKKKERKEKNKVIVTEEREKNLHERRERKYTSTGLAVTFLSIFSLSSLYFIFCDRNQGPNVPTISLP